MTILNLLASKQGLKGDDTNIELAKKIAETVNKNAIAELVENLNNTDKNIQSDCIKTLYETGFVKPELIADYYAAFLDLLKSKNNRLIWGAMIALSTITLLKSKEIFGAIILLKETINKGSVITIDCGVDILAKLNTNKNCFDTTDKLLSDILWKCPIKQLPMYIEKSMVGISAKNKEIYLSIIAKRLPECEKDTQVKRLEKAKTQIEKIKNN